MQAGRIGPIETWRESTSKAGMREAQKRINQFLVRRGYVRAARVHNAVLSRSHERPDHLIALGLTRARQYKTASKFVRRLAAAKPSSLMLQQWLARLATVVGDRETAAAAWTAAKAAGPAYMADEFDARIELAGSKAASGARRIALIGNCQVYPLARYVRQLTGARVAAIAPRDFVDPILAPLVVDEIRGFDFIVTQPVQKGWGALQTKSLKEVRPDLALMPSLVFSGFQPDLLPLSAERWAGPKHTFAEFHSLLGMAAFLRGFSADRAADLFNSYVFAKLGYFDEYDTGKRYLLDEAASMGLDISEDMQDWERHGVFFHTFNHPAVPVLWSIAKKIAAKLALPIDGSAFPEGSYFRENVWPLYPELGKRRGLEGAYMFQPPNQPAVDLRAMLAKDFEAYAATDFDKMDVKRPREVASVLESIGARP